jgi:hypothetical protein
VEAISQRAADDRLHLGLGPVLAREMKERHLAAHVREAAANRHRVVGVRRPDAVTDIESSDAGIAGDARRITPDAADGVFEGYGRHFGCVLEGHQEVSCLEGLPDQIRK